MGMLDEQLEAEDFLKWVDKHQPEDLLNSKLQCNGQYELAVPISKQLHAVLLKRTKSDARTIVKSAGSGEGLSAWRQLVIDFAPKSASDASALCR